ncbi:ankyrin repeat domain-containing protein [Dongia sp.]|uniref:ankyrin repeat domain-containing protein n=1 Tax=Dongia sp. TaxID=1977262 RepID=UPI0035B41C6E
MNVQASRRYVLRYLAGAAVLCCAAPLLTACGGPGGGTGANSGLGRLEIPDQPASQATKDLWKASQSGDVAGVKAALAAGADIEGIDFSENNNGRRALNYAALNNRAEVIEALLAAGANIESQNRTRFTPLHHAAEAGAIDAIKVLLKHGADKRAKMYRGGIPQQIAEYKGFRDAALLLVP